MKLLYCSDLHGNEQHYERLHRAAEAVRPELVILGGDLLPDDNPMDPESLGRGQPRFVRESFRKHMADLRAGSGCQGILVIMGNHDWGSSLAAMKELGGAGLLTVLEHGSPAEFGGVRFFGFSHTPPTPWYSKDFERLDLPGDQPPLLGGARWDERFSRISTHAAAVIYGKHSTIADELEKMPAPDGPWVFVAHCPPYGSKLDMSFNGVHLGSKAIRSHIEKHQPLLSLHGHIHESPAVSGAFQDRIGNTTAVNIGQNARALQYGRIEIDVKRGAVTKVESERQA